MAEAVDLSSGRQENPPLTDEMKVYVDVLKRELDEELRVAERLDAKARGFLTSASIAAAAAQAATVAFIAQADRGYGALAAAAALVVILVLGRAIRSVIIATATEDVRAIDLSYTSRLEPFAFHGDPVAIHNLADMMMRVLIHRRSANVMREQRVTAAQKTATRASSLIAGQFALLILLSGANWVL